jgi:hypothetical protein
MSVEAKPLLYESLSAATGSAPPRSKSLGSATVGSPHATTSSSSRRSGVRFGFPRQWSGSDLSEEQLLQSAYTDLHTLAYASDDAAPRATKNELGTINVRNPFVSVSFVPQYDANTCYDCVLL